MVANKMDISVILDTDSQHSTSIDNISLDIIVKMYAEINDPTACGSFRKTTRSSKTILDPSNA